MERFRFLGLPAKAVFAAVLVVSLAFTGCNHSTNPATAPSDSDTGNAPYVPGPVNAAAPVITAWPAGGSYERYTAATLTVTAASPDGGYLSYQWYNNGSTNSTTGGNAAGTTAGITPSTTAEGTTYYYVVVTNTNNAVPGTKTATATSVVATITVSVFEPVTGITGVLASGTVGIPVILSGTVAPGNATHQTIGWSVKSAGTTGAAISGGNSLTTTAAGSVTVTATIINGLTVSTNYTEDFTITVSDPGGPPPEFVPVLPVSPHPPSQEPRLL
jgi:hypothetical protein